MKRLIKLTTFSFLLFILLLSALLLFTPFERFALTGLWLARGQGAAVNDFATQLIQENPKRYKPHILSMLPLPSKESVHHLPSSVSINTKIAMHFAAQMLDDPDIKQRLTLIANNHTNSRVKCQSKELLHTNYEIIVYAPDYPEQKATRFAKVDNFVCE